MKRRTPLRDRTLPNYTRGEEIMNMVTHIVGFVLGILTLPLGILTALHHQNTAGIIGSAIYSCSMITVYAISSIYHGLHPSTGKKVLQILDHCAIYFLICGSYTPVLLSRFVPVYPTIGWWLLSAEWIIATLAVTLTAIDLKKFTVFSMICYIALGWGIIFFIPQTIAVLSRNGFALLLMGGIVYTIGAVLYGIGSKVRWMHSVFHIFVLLGSIFQFLAIWLYAL